jgi:threonylcarbamoyladenosine tRNA methylthiotransferase MtaB
MEDVSDGYFIQNFGCRATQADGAALEQQFEQLGLDRALTAEQASVVVLNTCTVTAAADQDARAAIRRVRRQNPEAKIVVTGCYAQRAPEEIAALPGVSVVVGNSHKHRLAQIALHGRDEHDHSRRSAAAESELIPLSALTPAGLSPSGADHDGGSIFVSDIFAHTELLAAPVFESAGSSREGERTRPNLKIQDGCDNRCSFCVIPYVRGQSRSLQPARILDEVRALVVAGYREVVLSGINLGRWGRDLTASSKSPGNDLHLAALIRSILAETTIEKLRISSVEPMDWTDELIALVAASPRIAKHAHVPLQSGSDTVLRRMHRKYRPWHYREKIEKIRAAMPEAAIGADVMVGFPGETEAEFDDSRRLIEDLPFTYLHVFTYSARPGTPAAALPGQVPVQVARERNSLLRELAAGKKLEFMRRFVGQTIPAITLQSGQESFTEALTDNYLKLHLDAEHEPNRWVHARVERVENDALVGSLA